MELLRERTGPLLRHKQARMLARFRFLSNTFCSEAVSTACYVHNRSLGQILLKNLMKVFVWYISTKHGFLEYNNLVNQKEFEEKPAHKLLATNPMVDRNQANLHTGQQESKQDSGTKDKIDSGNSQIEDETDQDCFELPIWHSYSSTNKSSSKSDGKRGRVQERENKSFWLILQDFRNQEKEANGEARALRKNLDQGTEILVTQGGAAKSRSTNIFSTVSQTTKASGTNLVNTGGTNLVSTDTTNSQKDDSEFPPLEDIHQDATDGIFTHSSYDDEGAVADFTNLETVVNVSPIPTSRINPSHPSELILGDPTSAVQTRSKLNKSSETHAFVSYVQKQRRTNHKDFHHCLFACFLSQHEPKKISEALEDESWVDAMQEELLQFEIQKVWILVDLPYGKKAIGTKWVYRNKKDEKRRGCKEQAMIYTPIEILQKPKVKDEEGHSVLVLGFKSLQLSKGFLDSDYAGVNLDRKSTTGGKITPLFDTMLVQPTQDEGASSESQSVEQPSPSPTPTGDVPNESLPDSTSAQPSEVPFEQQPDLSPSPSPRPSPNPSPTPIIPDSIPEPTGENLGDHSFNDTSLSGNEDAMTLQNVYDLCISLCKQVSDQAKEIEFLKAKIKRLKKKATPVINHFKAYQKRISKEQRQQRKRSSKKKRVQKESVSKQGRKNAKGDGKAKENAQSKGRTKEMMDEDKETDEVGLSKETDEVGLSTEDEVSTAKEGVSTDFEKVSTDRPKLSTDDLKVSTDEHMESNDDQVNASEEIFEGTKEQEKGIEEKVESTAEQKESTEEQTKEEFATQASQTSTHTPTSMIFGDDETIATLLINMSKAKAVSKEKEKGVELKDVEDTDRPRPTSTRSTLTLKPLPKIDPKDKGKKKIEEEDETESEDDDIPQAVKTFKQLESDEELARKVQEEWEAEEEKNKIAEEEATNEALIKDFDDIKARIEADRILAEKLQEQEREQFSIEERAKFLHDTIAAQRKFLAQQRSQALRNKPPTKNQLRNQMMTYIKHVGNYKHADLKSKKFEEIQALYEKIKRFNEDFISTRSAQDERFIKRMNEKGVGLSKSEVIKKETKGEVKIEDKEEESTRKRKLGTRKKMKSRKRRYIQHTSEDDSDKENDDLRLYLTIAQDEEKEVDYEVLDKKYPIIDWKTVCLGTKPQIDESKEEEINLNVVTRSNGQERYFSILTKVLSIFDREDLNAVYQLVMDKYQDEMPEGFERVLWGDLKVLFNPDEQDEFWNSQQEWKIIKKKYPLKKEIVVQMLNLRLESEEESTMALELIRFIKKVLADLESEEQG
ncbi:hypothetical protein Tco_0318005 [Tanacetum coccineum]